MDSIYSDSEFNLIISTGLRFTQITETIKPHISRIILFAKKNNEILNVLNGSNKLKVNRHIVLTVSHWSSIREYFV